VSSIQLSPPDGAVRVVTRHGALAEVLGRDGAVHCSGHDVVTGDWVVVEEDRITDVLERRTVIARRRPGRRSEVQALAANVDVVFIVEALGTPINERRIERYLTLVWDGGATPVIVLSKADRSVDLAADVEAAEEAFLGVSVVALSAIEDEDIDALTATIPEGATIALLGPSGVGKSTLLNRLAGNDIAQTSDVRSGDDKGRHTTTRRTLSVLERYAVIDTPGLREIGLAGGEEGIRLTFDDVDAVAERCRFGDCTHAEEPGCAVREAVEDGTLDTERVGHYRQLLKEQAAEALRQDAAASRREGKKMGRMIREAKRWRNQRRGGD
jgi:ribosome biogenesis GTPase